MDNVDKVVKKYLKPQFQLREKILKEAAKYWMIGAGIITILLLCTGEWPSPSQWSGVIVAGLFFAFILVFIPYIAVKGKYESYKTLENQIMREEDTSESGNPACKKAPLNGYKKSYTSRKTQEETTNQNHTKEDLQHNAEMLHKDNEQLAKIIKELQKENNFLKEQLKKSNPNKSW